MNARRTRAASRREESSEPSSLREGAVARQTRSSSKRAGPPSDASPQSKHTHFKIPQRGTRRRRRRSLESVATNDFPKSTAEHASPDPPVMDPEATESPRAEHVVLSSDTESEDDSYHRLKDLLDFDLPKLSRWCDRVFEALTALTFSEPTIEWRKKLKTARKHFNLARRPLAETSAAYIDLASSNLPYRDDPHTYKFTRKANLISLLLSIHDLHKSDHDAANFLQTLDEEFPACLDSDSSYFEGTSLAYRVRCRRLIELLREELETDPLVVATTLFCQQSANTTTEAMQRLREGPFRSFGHEDQGDYTSSSQFKTQMDDLVSKLSLPTKAEIDQAFDETYSRDELFKDLRLFASDIYLHFIETIKVDNPPSDSRNANEADGVEPGEQEGLFVSDDHQLNDGSDSDASSEHGYHQLKTLTKEPSFIQGPGTLAAVRQSESYISKNPEREQPLKQKTAKEKMTESQITDAIRRLNPAEVLGDSSDDEDDDEVVPTGNRAAEPRSRSNSQELGVAMKRTRPEEDDDDVDDYDDFEVNEQVINESRRHRYDDPDIARPVPKRSRFSADQGKTAGRAQSPAATPAGTNLTNDDLVTLSRAARANKLAHKGRPAPQLRERWSSADTNRLLDLIADPNINCSWSEMERQGGFQTYRNQQAIRDKARNLKKGYLCADAILPSGFDLVYLSKKEKSDVIASGHNPDRMEDDIDERGRVIHNLWKDRLMKS